MSLFGQDFKHYMDVTVEKKDTERMAVVSLVRINNIRMNDIVEYIYEKLDPRNNLRDPTVKIAFEALPIDTKMELATSMFIYRYCIHRILTLSRIYDVSLWQYHLTDDYYAQEISSITLKADIATNIDKSLRHMVTLRDNKKLEYVLEMEFKHVLPEVQNRQWHITTVNLNELRFTNETLYRKYLDEDLDYLNTYKLPRALCVRDGAFYRVIDGYHRLAAVEKSGGSKCLIIYC